MMQGCSDSHSNLTRITAYKTHLTNMSYDLRMVFSSYAVDNKVMNINFIDAGIFEDADDQATNCTYGVEINNVKKEIANLAATNYLIKMA